MKIHHFMLSSNSKKEYIHVLLAEWSLGKLSNAYQTISQSLSSVKMRIEVSPVLGEIALEEGRLLFTENFYKQTINTIEIEEGICNIVEPSLLLGLSKIACLKGQFLEAKEYLNQSFKLGEKNSLKSWERDYYKQESILHSCNYDYIEALKSLNKSDQHKFKNAVPIIEDSSILRVNVYIEQERIEPVTTWMKEQKLEQLNYINDFMFLTYLKGLLLLFSKNKNQVLCVEASELSERLITHYNETKRAHKKAEVLIIMSCIYKLNGQLNKGATCLNQAIDITVIESYKLPFIKNGEIILDVLEQEENLWNNQTYVSELIKAIKKARKNKFYQQSPHKILELVVPLSKREREILLLISQGLSNEEISKKLFLAISTVKNYNQNLFGKLQVKNRTEAVKKAVDLGVI